MAKQNKGLLPQSFTFYKPNFNNVPLKEYPRPNLKRDSYLSLNGEWEYKISSSSHVPSSYEGKVIVPYAIESILSGVYKTLEPDEFLFYHKKVVLPSSFNKGKIILHFDGVDQIADVFINGEEVKTHIGGYTPFEVVISNHDFTEFDLVVRVKDTTDTSYHSRGKQVLKPSSFMYTSTSGIYKPVWMESVGEEYIKEVMFYPDYDHQKVEVKIVTPSNEICKIKINDKENIVKTNSLQSIDLDDFHPWSTEDPYLYNVSLSYMEDKVSSYFGVRKIEIKDDGKFKRIYLNGKKIFLSGLLDQGYYFLGNLTPKDYLDYEDEIKKVKDLGYNVLRVHIKTECDMFYYLADKLGMLIIQDFPCGGTSYKFWPVAAPRFFPCVSNEKHISYKKLSREDQKGRNEFIMEGKEYIHNFNNYPSIIIYTIFNEGWGEFDPSKMYRLFKGEDDYRLFDTASGWYDAESDFLSIHTYSFPNLRRKNPKKKALIYTEVGGASLKVKGHSFYKGFFGHYVCLSKKILQWRYKKLYRKAVVKQISSRGLNMAIYTEVADCEKEYNGIYTFDRKVLKIDADIIKDINEELYKEIQK